MTAQGRAITPVAGLKDRIALNPGRQKPHPLAPPVQPAEAPTAPAASTPTPAAIPTPAGDLEPAPSRPSSTRKGRPPIQASEPLTKITTSIPDRQVRALKMLGIDRGAKLAEVIADVIEAGLRELDQEGKHK